MLRRYAVIYFSIILAFGVLAGLGLGLLFILFLWRAGEFASVADVVTHQLCNAATYGSAIHEDGFAYKLELASREKPAIIALGSSRVLQFRQRLFSTKFINAGRGMITPEEGLTFMRSLLARHKPKVVIIGLDFWWFNPNWSYPNRRSRDISLDIAKLGVVQDWLWKSKISVADIWRVAILSDTKNQLTQHVNIGVAAIMRGVGYRPDGSRDYGLRYSGNDPTFDDQGFANTLRRIERGVVQFKHAQQAASARYRLIDQMLHYLHSEGVTPVVVMPPLAGPVLELMMARSADFSYLTAIREYLAALKFETYDFTEPGYLGADDCEFVDGFHGGEVVHQRMIANIILQNPNSALAPHVNIGTLLSSIRKSSGHVLTEKSATEYNLAETDFLQIGCQK